MADSQNILHNDNTGRAQVQRPRFGLQSEVGLDIVKRPNPKTMMLCRMRLAIGNFSFADRWKLLMGKPIDMSFALAVNKKKQKIENISFDYAVGLRAPGERNENIPEFGDIQKRNSA